jgi:hypothetical protein
MPLQKLIEASPSDWKSLAQRMTWWYRLGAPADRFPKEAYAFDIGPGDTFEDWQETRRSVTLKRRALATKVRRETQAAKKLERREYMRDYMTIYRAKQRIKAAHP